MMKPKISVIVPVYKAEKYLHRCVDSILAQTFQDFEVLLIDDGSPDRSGEICDEYAKRNNRVRVIHKENKGPMVAREIGVQLSGGEYIMFVDSDDWIPMNAVENMFQALNDCNVDIVVGDMVRITDDGVIEKRFYNSLNYGNNAPAIIKSLFNEEIQHVLCGKLFRKELLLYPYIINENMINSEDALLFYQMIEHVNKMVCTGEVVYFYRRTPNSSSNREFSENQLVNYFSLYKYLYQNVINKYTENIRELDGLFFKSLVEMLKKGYSKRIIKETMLPTIDIDTYYSPTEILKNSRHLYKIYNLLLFSSITFRSFSGYLYRITHRS